MPERYYPMTEKYHVGDRILALLYEVRDTENGGAEVVLSRSHPELVKQLLIQEVPELKEEVVTIEKIVREAGYRTKLAVSSHDAKVDPLGSCVGVRGTRVKNVIRELNNEKIDIVAYTDNKEQLLQSLLHPIEVKKISYDREKNEISIVVADEDYPIVIGKKGMNTRLNAALVDVTLNVKKLSDYQEEISLARHEMALTDSPEMDQPLEIEDVNPFILDTIKQAGFDTPKKLLSASSKEIADKAGISVEMADDIMDKLRKKRV